MNGGQQLNSEIKKRGRPVSADKDFSELHIFLGTAEKCVTGRDVETRGSPAASTGMRGRVY
jgi:hypothetical protein